MLDLSKCFDTVDHQRLLTKLTLYGINMKWFSSYLSGHSQQVKVTGRGGEPIMSSSLPNRIGVYQGGSLSCLLYWIYANDMSLYIDGIEIIQFADETQLLIGGKPIYWNDRDHGMSPQPSLRLVQWKPSQGKCSKIQMIVFGTRAMLRNQPKIAISFCGSMIKESRVVENLGLYMDRYQTFVEHVGGPRRGQVKRQSDGAGACETFLA